MPHLRTYRSVQVNIKASSGWDYWYVGYHKMLQVNGAIEEIVQLCVGFLFLLLNRLKASERAGPEKVEAICNAIGSVHNGRHEG